MDECSVSVLNTPIKKIRNLTIHSPGSTSPIKYPNLNDFPLSSNLMSDGMIDKGYSQTLSSAVLQELDSRVKEISSNVSPTFQPARSIPPSRKRYSGIHKPLFSKMDSISSHYAATRRADSSPQDISSSATKKRRTLNGPEEIFFTSHDDPSPTRRKAHVMSKFTGAEAPSALTRQDARGISNDMFAARLQPLQLNVPLTASSPKKFATSPSHTSPILRSSPIKSPGISPSKGSMNLHGLLSNEADFAKPEGPVRIRQSSLQMAGVKPSRNPIPSSSRQASSSELSKQRSNLELQKKPSIDKLRKKPSASFLNSDSSIHSLSAKSTMGNLQKKQSIPNLQKKTSIPNLQKKPPIPTFQSTHKSPHTSTRAYGSAPADSKGDNHAFLAASSSVNKVHEIRHFTPASMQMNSTKPKGHDSLVNHTSPLPANGSLDSGPRPTKAKVTIPKPFSLYSKPTISSSQKTFDSQRSLHSTMSNVSSSASQRSLNRFQKFKNKFS